MTREEAIIELKRKITYTIGGLSKEEYNATVMAIEALSAEPIVIRAKTFMRKEDFDKWAEDIKRQGENIICIPCDAEVVSADADRPSNVLQEKKPTPIEDYMTGKSRLADRPSVEIKECKPLCTEQKIAVEEFLNAPRITEECAIELLQMTGWLQEHDKEIGRPSGEWELHKDIDGEYGICSVCGNDADFSHYGKPYAYCPNCGARMENTK